MVSRTLSGKFQAKKEEKKKLGENPWKNQQSPQKDKKEKCLAGKRSQNKRQSGQYRSTGNNYILSSENKF